MKDPVVQVGAEVLRAKALPVAQKDFGSKALLAVIKRMQKVLAAEEFGVALAAPQIGESLRLFVVAPKAFTVDDEDEPEFTEQVSPPVVFINPQITRLSRKKHEMAEGCLSVRGKYGSVLRHDKATVQAQDIHGKTFTYHGTGLIAHIFQHEVDHLDGVLYVDKAEKLEDEKKEPEEE